MNTFTWKRVPATTFRSGYLISSDGRFEVHSLGGRLWKFQLKDKRLGSIEKFTTQTQAKTTAEIRAANGN